MHNGISRIQIKGYKSLKDVDLELRSLNVLIGANAAGKSNFLSAFRMLNALTDQKLQAFIGKQGGASSVLHYGPKTTRHLSVCLWFSPFHGEEKFAIYRVGFKHIPPDVLIVDQEELGQEVAGESILAWIST